MMAGAATEWLRTKGSIGAGEKGQLPSLCCTGPVVVVGIARATVVHGSGRNKQLVIWPLYAGNDGYQSDSTPELTGEGSTLSLYQIG